MKSFFSQMRPRPGSLLLAVLLLGMLAGAVCARELDYRYPEPAVHAALIYRFAQFTYWPADSFARPDSPLIVAIRNPQLVKAARTALVGKTVVTHPVVVVPVLPGSSLPPCHVLVLDTIDPLLLASASSRPILTIGNTPGFAAAGGIVELSRLGTKTRFGINLAAAQQSGLSLSSDLLKLAIFTSLPPREGTPP